MTHLRINGLTIGLLAACCALWPGCGGDTAPPEATTDGGTTLDTGVAADSGVADNGAADHGAAVDGGAAQDGGPIVDVDACVGGCEAPICGDGVVQAGEPCDDGNEVDTDACTNSCRIVYMFTTAGAVGRQGPGQAAVDAAYAGTTLASAVTVTSTGIQRWVVPVSGTYRVTAQGAAGFAGTYSSHLGATMAGDFDLVAGDSLYVLVGQGSTPVDGHHYYHSPGGGGSFVALGQTLATTTPLVVAGGGGGGHPFETHLSPANATCGSTSEAGNGGYTGTLGGVQGSWGGAAGGMGSAAGFYSGAGESTASAFQDGGLGAAAGMGVSGGFGGGGAVEATTAFVMASTAGGGGGYSGGGASVMGASYSFPAGGGGSFNGGRNQENVACGAAAAGTVQIEALTVATPDARAPTAGAAATIGAVTGTSVTLSWGAATDDVSAPSDLQYAVVYATTDSLNGVAQALATGTPALQWSPTPSPTVTVSRLLGSTTYYFAVLVRDARGNTALYGPGALSATTSPVYVFTNAGASGHQGPTQAAVNAAYTGTSLASSVTVTGTGIQQWMVPATGVYRIEAYGAQGATNSPRHARGAQLRGTFDLVAGDSLFVLVGQAGTGTPDVYAQVGGGGGTFVAQGDSLASTVPLLVAGGGGGWGTRGYPYEGIDYADQDAGSISTSGNTGTGGIVGGADGARGGVFADSSNRADAAGGFFDGQGGVSSQAFQNGGLGAFFVGASGGFGGGGAAMTSVYGLSGGGGGYSGGGSSEATNGKNAPGGGGGSFNAGTDQRNEWGGNSGHGRVVIIQQ